MAGIAQSAQTDSSPAGRRQRRAPARAVRQAKADLRRSMTSLRARVARADVDGSRKRRFGGRLTAVLDALKAQIVVGYVPIGAEIDPGEVLAACARLGMAVFLPNWQHGAADFVHTDTGEYLVDDGKRTAVLIPGVAFDARGGRLGRGGGWYDRMLVRYPRAVRVGCGYDVQVVERVPRDPWDVAMDHVVTDARSIAVDGAFRPARGCADERT